MAYTLMALLICGAAVGAFVVLAPVGGHLKVWAMVIFLVSLALPAWWPSATVAAALLQVIEGVAILTYFRVTGGR